MRFVADECCDAVLVERLRQAGHDVVYIKDVARGADDSTVLQMAFDEKRLLLTEDKDFGELVVRLQLPAYGIVLLRINPADAQRKWARLQSVLAAHAERLPGAFAVIDRGKVRFRPLKVANTSGVPEKSPPRKRRPKKKREGNRE